MVLNSHSGLSEHMNRPLKRNLVVRSHASKAWNRRVHGLKICKVEWVFQSTQHIPEFVAEPRFPLRHASSCTPLNLGQFEVIGYVTDGLDAHFLKLINGAGVDSGYVSDVVSRARRIALVEELAPDGRGAMAS